MTDIKERCDPVSSVLTLYFFSVLLFIKHSAWHDENVNKYLLALNFRSVDVTA